MEALRTIGIDWKLLIAQLINFAILVTVLYKFAYRPVLGMLEKRSKTIAKSLEDAKAIEQQRVDSEAKREKLLLQAQHEADRIVSDARATAEELQESLIAKAKQDAAGITARAEREAAAAQANVVAGAQAQLADLITEATGKVLREKVTKQRDERLVTDALKEVRQ